MDFGERPWYAVRCVFALDRPETPPGTTTYEERITLWRVSSPEEAIRLAEDEGELYANELEIPKHRYLKFAQSFHLYDEPTHSGEIFSLMRDSTLSPDEYLNQFFDTGSERLHRM